LRNSPSTLRLLRSISAEPLGLRRRLESPPESFFVATAVAADSSSTDHGDGKRRRVIACLMKNGQLRPTGKWPPHELSSVNSASAMNVSFIWSPSRWADESKQTLTLEIGIERQGRTDLHRPLNTVLKKPRRPACRRGSLCAQAGRPIRPNTNVPGNLYLSGYRNWYLSG